MFTLRCYRTFCCQLLKRIFRRCGLSSILLPKTQGRLLRIKPCYGLKITLCTEMQITGILDFRMCSFYLKFTDPVFAA